MKYKFTLDFWNECHEKNFRKIQKEFVWPTQPKFLEIGTFEGRTASWLLDNMPDIHLTIMDPDTGPHFHHNMKDHLESKRCEHIKNYSKDALIKLRTENKSFDLIYVDGSHHASSVLEDAILSWRLLNKNGILLFDDYSLVVEDNWFYISHKEFEKYAWNGLMWMHPKQAIDSFMNIYHGQFEMYINNYQIGLRKICEIGKKNLNHWHENIGLIK